MKKILIFMFMCVVIIGFVFKGSDDVSKANFDAYKQNVVKQVGSVQFGELYCGDYVIVNDCDDSYISTSLYSTNYNQLHKFIKNYKLRLINQYVVNGVKVSEYNSYYFPSSSGYNFQVADYGDNYIIGYPYIFEGF